MKPVKSEIPPCVASYLFDQTILNGGGTVLNPFGLANVPLVGYIVGVNGAVFDKASSMADENTWHAALCMVEQGAGPLMVGPNNGVGTWECDCCGNIHIDAVTWTVSENHARGLCLKYGQAAYFDVEKGEAVYVEPVGPDDDTETQAVDGSG